MRAAVLPSCVGVTMTSLSWLARTGAARRCRLTPRVLPRTSRTVVQVPPLVDAWTSKSLVFHEADSPPAWAWRITTSVTVRGLASVICNHFDAPSEHHFESPLTLPSMALSAVSVAVHAESAVADASPICDTCVSVARSMISPGCSMRSHSRTSEMSPFHQSTAAPAYLARPIRRTPAAFQGAVNAADAAWIPFTYRRIWPALRSYVPTRCVHRPTLGASPAVARAIAGASTSPDAIANLQAPSRYWR